MVWTYALCVAAGATGRLWIAVPAALQVVFFVLYRRGGRFGSLQIILLAAVCGAHGFVSRTGFEACRQEVVRLSANGSAPGSFAGRVVTYPQQRPGGARFCLETHRANTPIRLLVSAVDFRVGYGDSVSVTGTLSGGRRDRWGYLYARDVHGYLRAGNREMSVRPRRGWWPHPRRAAWRLHEACRVRLARYTGRHRGLPTALALGDRSWIGRDVRASFTVLGVNHLLALSGMHLGLIAGIYLALFGLFTRANRIGLLLLLTAYVLTVGEAVSLYRAYAMALILIAAHRCERPVRPMDVLGTALLVVLLCRPGFLYSVGFQLSFAATAAVLLCVSRLPVRRRGGLGSAVLTGSVSSVIVSLCVQVFLLPLQLKYFGGVSLSTPLTTLLFLPAVAVEMLATGAALLLDLATAGHVTVQYGPLAAASALFERALLWSAGFAPPLIRTAAPNCALFFLGQAIWWWPPGAKTRIGRRLAGNKGLRLAAGATFCVLSFVFN